MQQHTAIGTYPVGTNGSNTHSIGPYAANIIVAKVLTWMPGTIPENVPIAAPMSDMVTIIRTMSTITYPMTLCPWL